MQPPIPFCPSAVTDNAPGGLSLTEHIVALFQSDSAAAAAERDLENAGIAASAMRRYTPAEMEKLEPDSAVAAGTETGHSSGGGFWAWLLGEETNTTTPRSAYSTEGNVYDRHARAGNTVLSVMLNDESLIHQAVTILDAHHPIEIDEHTHETEPTFRPSGSVVNQKQPEKPVDRRPGWTTRRPRRHRLPPVCRRPLHRRTPARRAGHWLQAWRDSGRVAPVADPAADEVIPLAEEQLEVGKRTVDRGTTRVRRYVVEKPVEQNVTLHGERVTIERRRPVEGTSAAGGAFEERTIEVQETEEVPVVGKTTRWWRRLRFARKPRSEPRPSRTPCVARRSR